MGKIILRKPVLFLLYGFPGSGKTYFARQLSEHIKTAHIQEGRLRGELFETPLYNKNENDIIGSLMNYITEEFLRNGVSTVYDMNAMRLNSRRKLRDMAKKNKTETLLIWFQIDIESAFDRVIKRDRRKIDDRYSMPLDRTSFERLVQYMQNPNPTEDYVVLSGKHNFETQSNMVLRKLLDMQLLDIESVPAKTVRPELVNRIPNPAAGRVDDTRRNILIR
jgi:predicted kinase